MEKKLTDKEIVTALEICKSSKSCRKETGCPLRDCINCHTELAKRVLDLIHRLQSENENLKAAVKIHVMDIDELHKEREKRVEEVYPDFMQDYKIMRDELNSTMSENAELQKQVDELKERLRLAYEECEDELEELFEQCKKDREQAVKDTAKEILQSVGDIVDDGDDRFKYKDYQWHKRLCERYGVEVE